MKKDRDNNNKVRYILSLSRSNLIIFSFKQTDDVEKQENGEEMVTMETANENLNEAVEDVNKDSQEGTLAALRAKHNSNMAELGELSITTTKAKAEKKKTTEAEIRSKAREAALARMEGESRCL